MMNCIQELITRFTVSFFVLIIFVTQLSAQLREIITLQSSWKFAKGEYADPYKREFDDTAWRTVSIPHDWAIEGPFIPDGDGNTAKLPWKGEGWYRYKWEMPSAMTGKRIYMLFDGVMAFPKVYVNGTLTGRWDYGYNSFYLDITNHLHADRTNTIAVHVDTWMHDSRWYPGAGIYRKVQLIAVNPVHAEIWGTHITTPIIKPNYTKVNITTAVRNTSNRDDELMIEQTIISPQGKELVSAVSKGKVSPGINRKFETTLTLTNPQRWDIRNGTLYRVRTTIKQGDKVLDVTHNDFGVRSIRFTPDDGFYLNDRRVQLNGVNLHHDHGPLGAAFYPRAMERQLELLQEMGCNAIRTSHNVAAPELLEMCDRMGILVFNEIFDKYDRKADILDTTNFEAFTKRNIRNFIQRDRNHPSVFMWSVGNEIGDVQWNVNGGFAKLRLMINEVRYHDSSRPVTLVCDSRNSAALRHFEYYDVHNWNYGRRYDLARQLEPNKAVVISESASTVSTRGFYEWPLPGMKTDFTKSLQVSSYDLNAPDWAEIADDDFMWQQDEPYIAGEFVWTGFDYLGEPTPYDNASVKKMGMTDRDASVSSYFGIFDLVGIPKDRYYLYKSYWDQEDTTIHILPHWNWPDKMGDTIPVFVYTNGDCVELFLNGTSLGVKCKTPDAQKSVERFRLIWHDVVYQPGVLKAVAYKEGQRLGETINRTTEAPYQLRLTPDRSNLLNDGMDLSYILVEAVDQNGNPCPDAHHQVELYCSGAGHIAGVGNGNPQSTDPFQSDQVKLFYGKAMIILKSAELVGMLSLRASARGLKSASVEIVVNTE